MDKLREGGRVATTVLIATALLAGGIHASTVDAAAFRAGDVQAQSRTCLPAAIPKQLPDIAAVIDVEGFRREIAREGALGTADGELIFSIRFAADGQREWLQRIGTDSNAPSSRLQRLATEHLMPQTRSREPWSVRLHVASGDSITFRVARSEVCPAQPVVDRGAVGTGRMILTGDEMRELQRSRDGTFAVDVSPTGMAVTVEVLQSTGSRVRDEEMLQRARTMRFHPALVDGIPVAGRFEVRSRMRMR